MKKLIIAIATIFCLTINICFAQDTTARPILFDYEGKAEGKEIPNWVIGVAGGDTNSTIFPDNMQNKKIFATVTREKTLESAKSRAKTDILKEFYLVVERVLSDYAETRISSSTDTNKETNRSAYPSELPDSLKKTYDFWTKINEVNDKNKIIDTYYEYYSVYTIDKDLWNKFLQSLI